MSRLTKWNSRLNRWTLPQGKGTFRLIADRLADYENTGVEPNDILRRDNVKKEFLNDIILYIGYAEVTFKHGNTSMYIYYTGLVVSSMHYLKLFFPGYVIPDDIAQRYNTLIENNGLI